MLAFRRFFMLFLVLGVLGSPALALVPQEKQDATESQATAGTETSDDSSAAGTAAPVVADPVQDSSGVSANANLPWVAYLIPFLGIAGLVFTFWKSSWVAKQEAGTERMMTIANNITEGAMSFLKAEYSILAIFVVVVAVLLGYAGSTPEANSSPLIAVSFILGAICSALAGFIGMRVATKANVRTTNAARTGLGQALEVAFAGGSVMGMGVVGLGVLGLSSLLIIYSALFGVDNITTSDHSADRVFIRSIIDRVVCSCRWWHLHQSS